MVYLIVWIAAQIITEMLPISSSGHLLLLQEFLYKKYGIQFNKLIGINAKDLESLYYMLHGLTLAVITLAFGKQWFSFFYSDSTIAWRPLIWLMLADLVTVVFYLCIKKLRINFPLGLGFFITILALLSTKYCQQMHSIEQWCFIHASILGAAQGIAFLPGISRLAFTTAVGCMLNYSLVDSFIMSWLLLAPLMAGALIKGLKHSLKSFYHAQLLNPGIVLTMLISSIASWYVLQIVLYLVSINALFLFGWYMCIPLLWWLILFWE